MPSLLVASHVLRALDWIDSQDSFPPCREELLRIDWHVHKALSKSADGSGGASLPDSAGGIAWLDHAAL